jgi:hypothetical protein
MTKQNLLDKVNHPNGKKQLTEAQRANLFKPGKGKDKDPRIGTNPNGKRGDWSTVYSELREFTPAQIIELVGGPTTPIGKMFKRMPPNVQIKVLLGLKSMAQYWKNPDNARLLATIMDRADGTPRQSLTVAGQVGVKAYVGFSPDDWDEDIEDADATDISSET